MHLGAFSVSLAVRDIARSLAFYTDLGFEVFHDASEHGYAILRNGTNIVGLFQGHIEKNTLTFNPGWDQDAHPVPGFADVRDIQAALAAKGIDVGALIDPESTGPAEFVVMDPDGNPILIDQHVDRPQAG